MYDGNKEMGGRVRNTSDCMRGRWIGEGARTKDEYKGKRVIERKFMHLFSFPELPPLFFLCCCFLLQFVVVLYPLLVNLHPPFSLSQSRFSFPLFVFHAFPFINDLKQHTKQGITSIYPFRVRTIKTKT